MAYMCCTYMLWPLCVDDFCCQQIVYYGRHRQCSVQLVYVYIYIYIHTVSDVFEQDFGCFDHNYEGSTHFLSTLF